MNSYRIKYLQIHRTDRYGFIMVKDEESISDYVKPMQVVGYNNKTHSHRMPTIL